jgi:hypothetical protein
VSILARTVFMGLTLAAGCARQLPPPAIPPPGAPALTLPQLDKERGRVVVDVVDGPTNVYRVDRAQADVRTIGTSEYASSTRGAQALCTSPCAVDLVPGRYTLGFPTRGTPTLLEIDDVDLGHSSVGYRRSLGQYERGGGGLVLGLLGATFGGMAVITGLALLPVGLAADIDGMALAGGITLVAGAILTTLGILAIDAGRTTQQPGSAIRFAL